MEHRWGERFALEVPVKLTIALAVRQGVLTDLSASGGFIRTAADLRPLTYVQIALDESAHTPARIVPAYVARATTEGAGVEWCEFAPRAVLELIRAATGRERSAREWRLRLTHLGAAGATSSPTTAL